MANYTIKDFRKNLKIEINGEPFVIVEANPYHPGKGPNFTITKIKSLITGLVVTNNYRENETFDIPNLETRTMEYLYKDENKYVFMDQTTYEQEFIEEDKIQWEMNFLKDNSPAEVLFHNGKAISVELETFVNLKVTKSDPGVKGNTAQNCTKPATLETGYTVQVPLYIEEGELVKVDTRDGSFVERAKG